METGTRRSGPFAWAAGVLRDHEMPWDEIRALLTTRDPQLVHRYLELHCERLDEWVADQRRTLSEIERRLTESAAELGGVEAARGRIG